MASIQQAVGLKCANSKYDVIVVQTLLNKFLIAGCLPPLAPLLVDGDFGNKTAEAIYAFQNGVMGWKKPDMRIDPWGQTIAALNGPLKWANKPFGGGGTYLPPPSAPDDLTYGDPVTITAMDATDRHVWAVSWGKIVYLSDAWTMTLNVQKEAGSSPIGRLYVLSHGWHDGPGGSPDQLQLRNNAVTAENFSIWEPAFRRLRPHFADSGEVVLLACLVGQNSALLRKLSASFQVPVYAGTGYTLMKSGAQTGQWVCCYPNGSTVQRSPHPTTRPRIISPFWSGLF